MFAQRLISGQGGPVTFDSLDRAARLTEAVEDSRDFFSWVDSNEKEPKYFSDWENLIAEYHSDKGIEWTKDIAIPSPYGFMGFDIIKPPVVVAKDITFHNEIKPISFGEPAVSAMSLIDCLYDEDDYDSDDYPLYMSEDGDDNSAGSYEDSPLTPLVGSDGEVSKIDISSDTINLDDTISIPPNETLVPAGEKTSQCKCGSTTHKRTNHKLCPLNKKC